MVNPQVDELSMMTYVSQFPDAKLKPGAPIKEHGDASKVKVSGPGVEGEGVTMGIPVVFYIDTKEAGHGTLKTQIEGSEEEVEVRIEDKKDGTYTCSYVPPNDGPFSVSVLWNYKHAKDSPFKVNVSPSTNPLACRAYGPGVEGGDLKENNPAEFCVETVGAGPGNLEISVRGPKGPMDCGVRKVEEEKFDAMYIPPHPGQYTVEVTFNNLQIRDSPFKVRVEPDRPDASKCSAEGPGIEESLVVGEKTWFTVHTQGAGKGELVTNIRSPHGEVPVGIQEEGEETTYTYTPNESGELVVTIKYGGEHIPGSRFRVQVNPPPDPSKCVAQGPGLAPMGVRVNEPANFKVKTKEAGMGDVSVVVSSPSGEIPVSLSSSSAYVNDYVYVPTEAGEYQVEINFAGQPIPGSIFSVAVTDSSKVKIEGPGMDGELLPANLPLKYVVDARGAGPGTVACHVQTPSKQGEVNEEESGPLVTKVDDEGIFEILYTPTLAGLQKMKVSFGESPIPRTPIRLNVYDVSKVVAEGPGLKDGNKTGELTYFTMDLKQAGDGNLHVNIAGPAEVPLFLKDQANDMIHAEYTPSVAGDYIITVELQKENVPGSPFEIYVKPKTDPSAVEASGPGLDSTDLTTGMLVDFVVDYSKAGEGEVQVNIQGPAGGVEYTEEDVGECKTKYTYLTDPDESGLYNVDILFADKPIPNSPFQVPVKWKPDPSRVVAEGAGLQGGTTKEWTEFDIDLRKAGEGGLNVNINGPEKVEVEFEDHKDNTMTVKYFPQAPGEYKVDIVFNEEHIPGSTFRPFFDPCTDATKCRAYGPGLRKDGVKVGDPGEFVINTSEGGKGAVDVIVNGPVSGTLGNNRRSSTPSAKPIITNNQDGTYAVAYNPWKVGEYEISIIFGDEEIPESPFNVNVTDPTKITVKGPGCPGTEENDYHINSCLCWTADCNQAGPGKLEATVSYLTPEEEVVQEVATVEEEDGVYQINCMPQHPLTYRLEIEYSENPLSEAQIVSVVDPTKVRVFGPAFNGANVNETTQFTIDTSEAGNGNLYVEMFGPSPDKLSPVDEETPSNRTFSISPTKAGEYQLHVKFGGIAIPDSPFAIPVRDISKLIIRGSGITGDGARVATDAHLTVDTSHSGPGPLQIHVTDPSGNKERIDLYQSTTDNPNIFSGSYMPLEAGHYEVAVQFNNEEIENSPFIVPIGQPENVRLDGEGLKHAFIGQDNVIDCFTEEAGPGLITAEFSSSTNLAVPARCEVAKVGDYHFQVHYEVQTVGEYEANISFNGFPIKEDPKVIQSIDLSKCIVSGPGVESGNITNVPTYFEVDTRELGKGELEVYIQDPEEGEVPTQINEVQEGIHQVSFTPGIAGRHVVNVLCDGMDVDQSPIFVSVSDPDKVLCTGSGLSTAIVNEPAQFKVDMSKAGEGSLNIQMSGPEEVSKIECVESESGEPYDVVYVAPKAGQYEIHIIFADKEVPGSPFQVECQRPPPDASKCKAVGLENPGGFLVDCSEAGGTGLLEVGVCGTYIPAEFVSVNHNGDYTFSVSYKISEPGKTIISVKWHDKHLTGSPFTVFTD